MGRYFVHCRQRGLDGLLHETCRRLFLAWRRGECTVRTVTPGRWHGITDPPHPPQATFSTSAYLNAPSSLARRRPDWSQDSPILILATREEKASAPTLVPVSAVTRSKRASRRCPRNASAQQQRPSPSPPSRVVPRVKGPSSPLQRRPRLPTARRRRRRRRRCRSPRP